MQLTDIDAYALKRALTRMDISNVQGISPAIQLMLNGLDAKSPEGWQLLNQVVSCSPEVMNQILKVDPKAEPPASRKASQAAFIPPLPLEACLSDAAFMSTERVAAWYKGTVDWMKRRSPMTPVSFLETGAIWLLCLAIARRVHIEFHSTISTSLYLIWVAETSKYAKSTGLETIFAFVVASMPHMLIPGQTSPEGMIEILSGALPTNFDRLGKRDQQLIEAGRKFAGQRGIMLDEYSGLLASARKEHMAGFIELLMRLYDSRAIEQHYTRSGGLLTIRNPGICILGATTPAALARAVTAEMWENGSNARYLMMFRENPPAYTTEYIKTSPPFELAAQLAKLHNALPMMRGEMNEENEGWQSLGASITEEAKNQYMAYTKAVFYDMITDDLDERLHGNYRRLHVQALKMALALATMDWIERGQDTKSPVIELGHFALGQQLAEKARHSLHRMMPVLSQSQDSKTQRDLLVVLKNHPGGLTLRDISRSIGRNVKDLRSAIDVLVESGEVNATEHQASQGGGKTHIYSLASSTDTR